MPPRDQGFQWPSAPEGPPEPPTPKSPMVGTLKFVAFAFGVGILAAYAFDAHGHRCESCGHAWWHLGSFHVGDEPAHRCSKCGTMQWWKNGIPAEVRQAHEAAHEAFHAAYGHTVDET